LPTYHVAPVLVLDSTHIFVLVIEVLLRRNRSLISFRKTNISI